MQQRQNSSRNTQRTNPTRQNSRSLRRNTSSSTSAQAPRTGLRSRTRETLRDDDNRYAARRDEGRSSYFGNPEPSYGRGERINFRGFQGSQRDEYEDEDSVNDRYENRDHDDYEEDLELRGDDRDYDNEADDESDSYGYGYGGGQTPSPRQERERDRDVRKNAQSSRVSQRQPRYGRDDIRRSSRY